MAAEATLQQARAAYARRIVPHTAGDAGPRLVAAFAALPRERFVGPPPWRTMGGGIGRIDTSDPLALYDDVLVSLDAGRGINNGQPSLHAECLAACDPQPGETALHVGAGTGYYTAVLALLVGAHGRVIAYEIEADLATQAARHLATWPQVEVRAASGTIAPLPAADVIYVSAGATHPLPAWLDALRPGGRLMFPLAPDTDVGMMLLVTRRTAVTYDARALMRVSFIACVGAGDARAADALRRALATRPIDAVRSLHRDDAPDASAWLVGNGWWLSTREAATREPQVGS
ncbi:MAG: hypothetical protein HS128_04420 [Ideonella sp.]|nr:hypothetical protein [Ideonella sp.]MCC7455441.1 hypothetical protein [Nitrospira sp.]